MFKLTRKAALMAAAASAALAFAAPALAQEEDTGEGEEIVVTLQKREQAIQDVPAAVTAYNGSFLEDLGVTEFSELAAFVPGFEVQYQSPNNPGFVMRGITSDNLEATNEPRVSVFQDGVSISRATGAYVELFDIERVEVAKGPQSTLFGRGALIGAVNIIQNKARAGQFDLGGAVEVGDFDAFRLDGMINIPLGEQAALRLSGRIKQREGYVENVLGGDAFNSIDTQAFRAVFSVRPADDVSIDVIYNHQTDEPTATAFKSQTVLPADPTTGAVLAGQGASEGAALAAGAGFGKGLGTERKVDGLTVLTEIGLTEAFTLNAVTSLRSFEASEVGDADGISLGLLTFDRQTEGEQFSQEVRLGYDGGGAFSWFAGVNFFKEEGTDGSPVQFDERIGLAQIAGQLNGAAAGTGLPANRHAPLALFGNTMFTGALVQGLVFQLSNGNVLLSNAQSQAIAANLKSGHKERQFNGQELTSWDVFADFTFKASERLEFSLGLRHTADEKDVTYESSVLNGRSILGGVIGSAQLASSGNPVAVGQANALLGALAVPGAANIPQSIMYPVPLFGLTFQPTANNGDVNTFSNEDSGATWRLTGLYRANDEWNVYANYARGRRPEAVGATSPAAPGGAATFTLVPAETVDSYEVGAKYEANDRRLRFDGAVFYYKYENFQTIEQILTTFVPTNAGEATAYGFEGQMFWRAASNVDLFGTYGYNHARFESGAREGNQFRLSPDHSFSIGSSVRLPLFGGELDFRPTYTWQSKVFFDDNNDRPEFQTAASQFVADTVQDEFQEAYGLLNLRLAYSPAAGPWKLEAFVENALDEEYITDAGNTGDALGLPSYIAGPPRMWGVAFTVRY
ncbi:MAG TPA: TonB-dependent receptor [Caulobacteraceae bacterium]|nr:TonB-dependent receptor [Caulobacteraceae bacterium]